MAIPNNRKNSASSKSKTKKKVHMWCNFTKMVGGKKLKIRGAAYFEDESELKMVRSIESKLEADEDYVMTGIECSFVLVDESESDELFEL